MFSKKFFHGITLVILSTPLIATAGLETFNYTNEDSSVRVTSGSFRPCSMDFGIYTPKANANGTPGYSNANDAQIKALCLTSPSSKCSADIFNTKNCTGEKVGHAELDLVTNKITKIQSDHSRYTFNLNNGGTVLNIRYSNFISHE